MRLARQLVALRFFLADRQQPDARPLDAEPGARIHRAHVRELQQVRRPAFDRRARIEQHRRSAARRHRRRQRRPIDAGQHAERRMRRDHAGPGMPGADQRRRLARPRRARRRRESTRAACGAAPCAGDSRHVDHVGRVDDAHVEIVCIGMSRQLGANQIRAADQIDAEPEIARGRDGAINGMGRRMIAAHRINSDAHGRPASSGGRDIAVGRSVRSSLR